MALGKVLNFWAWHFSLGNRAMAVPHGAAVRMSELIVSAGGHTVSLPSRLAAILSSERTYSPWSHSRLLACGQLIWPAPSEGAIGGISGLGEPGVWVGWELGPQDLSYQQHRQTIPQGGVTNTVAMAEHLGAHSRYRWACRVHSHPETLGL